MKDRYSPLERKGVNRTEEIFLDFGWIFREQLIGDVGIDAQVELVESGSPTGKLIGLQIKTGKGNFYETPLSYTFYLDNVHYEYWINHALPILLIGHIPETGETFWQHLSKENIEKTSTQYKVVIPKTKELSHPNSISELTQILNNDGVPGKLTKLYFDRELIEFIRDGGKISVYTMEWLHKSLGRGPFEIILIKNGVEEIVRKWHSFYTGDLLEVMKDFFPWADFGIDNDFYAANFDESVYSMFNKDYVHSLPIYPYDINSGEVGYYRIELTLNQLGDSFLTIADHLDD